MEQDELRKKRERDSRANRVILMRTLFLMGMCGIVLFIPLLVKLWSIAVLNHSTYYEAALDQQTRDVTVAASRGKILDARGNVLAISATVYNLILSPRDVIAGTTLTADDFASKAEFKAVKEDAARSEAALAEKVKKRQTLIVDTLCEKLELERETVEKRMAKTSSAYEIVAKNLEEEQAEELRAFISENKLGFGLYLTPTTKRYYPYANLASQVIGFVNDSGGAYGLEAIYDKELSGQAGRVYTAKNAKGTEMSRSYSNYVDAVDGQNFTLTIDSTIQSYAEQLVREGIKQYDVQNGGFCIVMNPKTGGIYAMVSIPDYDLNSPSAIFDLSLQAGLEKLKGTEGTTDEVYQKAVAAARNSQWRSKALNDTYEPGSTFKSMVLAAALEEGVVSASDTFFCPGYAMVNGTHIWCSKHEGHGSQSLAQAVANSCNPAFIAIGQRLGAAKFYQYFTDFGLNAYTGIDLQGEGSGQIWDKDYLTSAEGYLSLATASFGQRFTVTPVQLITAVAATINGGYVMEPYVVESVSDGSGNVIERHEPVAVRQVVSEQTSAKVREILENVVANGTGRNAYVKGYRIGGKTGTSETLSADNHNIVSFVGFAPANDPQVIVLMALDNPKQAGGNSNYCTTGTYISGGQMVAPKVGRLIASTLDHLGVEKSYKLGEATAADVMMPNLNGLTAEAAKAALQKLNLKCRTAGDGEKVTSQIPASGTVLPGGSEVVLYLGGEKPKEPVTVPNVAGKTLDGARRALAEAGLYMRASGNSEYNSRTVAGNQSVAGGTQVERGTVVDVTFVDTSISD